VLLDPSDLTRPRTHAIASILGRLASTLNNHGSYGCGSPRGRRVIRWLVGEEGRHALEQTLLRGVV